MGGGVHLCSHGNGSLSGIGHPAPPSSLQVQLRLPHPFPTKHIHTITLISGHHTKNQSFIYCCRIICYQNEFCLFVCIKSLYCDNN